MSIYLDLFLTFCRIGAFTFGGGYSMLPMLEKEVVNKHEWATNEEILDYFGVSQSIPGVIAVNTATFVGAKLRGVRGAACAALGVITPSFVIIAVIALFVQAFADLPAVQHAFAGILVAVSVLIVNAVVKLWKSNVKTLFAAVIFAAALLVTLLTGISPVVIVIVAILIGIVAGKWGKKA